jgi:hypothetical protein
MANLQKAPARVERLIPDFKEFRDTWNEANRRWRSSQRADGTTGKQGGGFAAFG